MQRIISICAAAILSMSSVSFAQNASSTIPYIAVGKYQTSNHESHPLIATSSTHGQSWFIPQKDAITLPKNSTASLDRASCNEQYCVAIGNYSSPENVAFQPLVEVSLDQGHSWNYFLIQPPEAKSDIWLNSVACNKQGCLIAGTYKNAKEQREIFTAKSKTGFDWSYSPLIIPLAQDREVDGINKIVCTEKSCVLAGTSTRKGFADYFPFIAITKNAGVTWTFPSIDFPKYIEALHCTNDVCLLGGGSMASLMIWASYDGGETWQKATIPSVPPKITLAEIEKLNCEGSVCVAVGTVFESSPFLIYPLLFTSQDKGLTWFVPQINSAKTLPISHDIELNDVSCKGALCAAVGGYVPINTKNDCVTYPLVVTSQDSGATWSYTALPTPPLTKTNFSQLPHLKFCDEGQLSSVTCDGNACMTTGKFLNMAGSTYTPLIFTTQDEGNTWTSKLDTTLLPTDFVSGGFGDRFFSVKRKKR